VDQILFSRDVLGLEVEKEFGKITGAFPQVALSSGMFCACLLLRRCFSQVLTPTHFCLCPRLKFRSRSSLGSDV
jgi:hypothetical protein